MSISTGSPSAAWTRERRLRVLGALEQAVDGREARHLQEVVTDNLRHLWRTGGKKGDDKPGRQPEEVWIRDGFVFTSAEDAHGPALPRLIQSKGLQLRLYLLMLFDAQCRHEAGSGARNVRPVSPNNGPYRSWSELVLSAPDRKNAQPMPWQTVRRLRERQIKEALVALETQHRLLDVAMAKVGRRRRDFDKLTLLAEDSNPDRQARYTVAEEQHFSVPREFFTNLWIFALTDTELACYLALRWAQAQVQPSDHNSFFIVSRERETNLRLTRTTWNSIERLQAFGLIQRTDHPGRDPYSGTIESFRDKWQAGEVIPARYAFVNDGVQQRALPTVRDALTNPVAPVRPDPLNALLGTTT
ncbi:hypothetical protein ACI2K4_18690 [Micromonospora sp. NPDC050397]|uniref:hypothetical protein n=1 Tax=Micromonospora sp. NPDC050397 TaxID=3364279 RepID=UPI00384D2CFF